MVKIYHNPRCRKSRETLALIENHGIKPEVIEYLKTPPSFDELKKIVTMLGIGPYQLIRRGEAEFKDQYRGKELSGDKWIEAMVKHPKLIERPIVINGEKAAIGRPPENVLEIL